MSKRMFLATWLWPRWGLRAWMRGSKAEVRAVRASMVMEAVMSASFAPRSRSYHTRVPMAVMHWVPLMRARPSLAIR